MNQEIINHYTNIDTLALILKNKTIRFNRLDFVDDITESDSFEVIQFANYLFVSCWTYESDESIPQWKLYTENMTGVRISLPANPFLYKPFQVSYKYKVHTAEKMLSPIPFDKVFTDDHFIVTSFMNMKNFCKKVEYTKDFVERKNQAIEIHRKGNVITGITINDATGLASLKSPDWIFQKEIRFILLILPSMPLPPEGPMSTQFAEQIPNYVLKSVVESKKLMITHFDIEIDPNILDNISVLTGPHCTEGQHFIVESLLKEHTSNGKLARSKLFGKIRKK